jgi:hypothetical protein
MVTHMTYHSFDFRSIDAAGLLIPALAVGLGFGWAVHRSRRLARILLLGLLTLAFLDLQFDPESVLPVWIVVAGTLLVGWALWEHYTRIVTLSLSAMLLSIPFRSSVAVRSWQQEETTRAASPSSLVPIVHIVLDEHAAPRAFPADVPEAVRARARVLEFYQRRGFLLYERAYSQYFWTHSSIPAMMTPTPLSGRPANVVELDAQRFVITDSDLFQREAGRGYRIHIVQTTFLDACSRLRELIVSCVTYPANSLSSLRLLPLDAPHRILLEHGYFLSAESYFATSMRSKLWRLTSRNPSDDDPGNTIAQWQAGRGDAGMALLALSHLGERLRAGLHGSYHYVHVLSPHFPYELDRSCKAHRDFTDRLGAGWLDGLWGNTTASRKVRWALYAGQVECLYARLDSLLATIDSAAPPQGVMIVIHGDHGSRIGRNYPIPKHASELGSQDLLDGFATLLAVRGPGITPGFDTSIVAIQTLVPLLVTRDTLSRRGAPADPVVLLEEYGVRRDPPVRLPAPSLAR